MPGSRDLGRFCPRIPGLQNRPGLETLYGTGHATTSRCLQVQSRGNQEINGRGDLEEKGKI